MKRLCALLLGAVAAVSLAACHASAPSAATPTVTALSAKPSTSTPSATPTLPSVAPTSASVVAAAMLGTPTWISIPSIGVAESIIPGALNGQGELEPPKGQVIWYQQATQQAGNSMLIAGHDEYDGPSNFWNLNEVQAGQPIIVTYSSGRQVTFTVANGKSELKTVAQTDRTIWTPQAGTPEIVVMTCDKYSPVVNHHHLSNFIVYAKEVTTG